MEMKIKDYSDDAHQAYGAKCEFIGCGWDAATCDVHHINYQEHQMVEDNIRKAVKSGDTNMMELAEKLRLEYGFGLYDAKTKQLPKDDGIRNTTVLCPNHHRYVHTIDLGLELLNYIPKRQK